MLSDGVGDGTFADANVVDPRVVVVERVHSVVRDAVLTLFTKVTAPPIGVHPETELPVAKQFVDLEFPALDDDRSRAVVGAVEIDIDGEGIVDTLRRSPPSPELSKSLQMERAGRDLNARPSD